MKKLILVLSLTTMIIGAGIGEAAQDAVPAIYPTAIFSFAERGRGVQGYGSKVSDILFASLVVNPDMYLVEREELEKSLEELTLSESGMVNPGQAVQLGQLTGAKILVTGSVIEADKTLYLVAKIIGTETSRVLGESVKGRTSDNLAALTEQLADQITAKIKHQAHILMPKVVEREDRIAKLKTELADAELPVVMIRVEEQHIGQAVIDPAAETELTLICKEVGFNVLDPQQGSAKQADIIINGEGFSEFAVRRGELVSVKARLEVKALDRTTDQIIAIDRQTSIAVGLSEQIAGKQALQDAAAAIAERLLPKLIDR